MRVKQFSPKESYSNKHFRLYLLEYILGVFLPKFDFLINHFLDFIAVGWNNQGASTQAVPPTAGHDPQVGNSVTCNMNAGSLTLFSLFIHHMPSRYILSWAWKLGLRCTWLLQGEQRMGRERARGAWARGPGVKFLVPEACPGETGAPLPWCLVLKGWPFQRAVIRELFILFSFVT